VVEPRVAPMPAVALLGPEIVARRTCDCVNRYCSHHQAIRAAWAPIVAAGQVSCWRCHEPIKPGQPWDLGHADHDITIYYGPECWPCNRSTMTRRKQPPARRWEL